MAQRGAGRLRAWAERVADRSGPQGFDMGGEGKDTRRVIHPFSSFRRNWDGVVLLLIIYHCIVVPLVLAFGLDRPVPLLVVDALVDGVLVLDLRIGAWTAYAKSGQLVNDPQSIRRHYLRSQFPFDFVAAVPLDWVLLPVDPWAASNVRLLKLVRLARMFLVFKSWERDVRINSSATRVVKLLLSILLLAHWVSCGWFLLAKLSDFEDTWAPRNFGQKSAVHQYVRCLYWAITTMTTVGYGDIFPTNDNELIFVMMVMLMGVSIYGYILGNVASLISNIDATSALFRQKMEEINRYMKHRRIPEKLQVRIRNYYEYIWTRHKGLDETIFLNDLPSSLRTGVALFLNADTLRKVPLFDGAEPAFLNSVVVLLRPQVYSPNDYIIRAGTIGREMYFLTRGSVEVISEEGQTLATLNSGSFFGEVSLLYSRRRTTSVRANVFCELFVLSKSDFDKVLADYADFAEALRETARRRYRLSPAEADSLGRQAALPSLPGSSPTTRPALSSHQSFAE